MMCWRRTKNSNHSGASDRCLCGGADLPATPLVLDAGASAALPGSPAASIEHGSRAPDAPTLRADRRAGQLARPSTARTAKSSAKETYQC
eukprot:scaffold131134_cov30-Tisochrysis_lutea.AAC.2